MIIVNWHKHSKSNSYKSLDKPGSFYSLNIRQMGWNQIVYNFILISLLISYWANEMVFYWCFDKYYSKRHRKCSDKCSSSKSKCMYRSFGSKSQYLNKYKHCSGTKWEITGLPQWYFIENLIHTIPKDARNALVSILHVWV